MRRFPIATDVVIIINKIIKQVEKVGQKQDAELYKLKS